MRWVIVYMFNGSWKVVAKKVPPQERFADLLVLQGVSVPAYADFHSADLNGNGVLMFEEWQQWV